MKKIFIKDKNEFEKENIFATKYVSPLFKDFYLMRYQIYRLKYSAKISRRKAMAELGILWSTFGEAIADERLDEIVKDNKENIK